MRTKPYTAPPFFPTAPSAAGGKVLTVRGHYQVREYTCGFASVLTVLRYYQCFVNEREIYQSLGTTSEGTTQTALVRELRRRGVRVGLRYDMSFNDMAQTIDRGRLIIGYHHPLEHWVVLNGYRREPDTIFVVDSMKNHRSEHPFREYGPKLRGFGMVCSPRIRRMRLRSALSRHDHAGLGTASAEQSVR